MRAHRDGPSFGRAVRRLLLGVVLIALLVVGGTAFRVWQVGRVDTRDEADMIVVLGAAQYNGDPSPYLEARLRHAKRLYDADVASRIVTSGGGSAADRHTEASAGRQWLLDRGVPAGSVLAVDKGRDTLSTVRAVAGVASRHDWRSAVLVSDPWHSLRAREMAGDVGLDTWVSPTHSGPVVQSRKTQLRYIVRETGALLYYRLSKEPVSGASGLG